MYGIPEFGGVKMVAFDILYKQILVQQTFVSALCLAGRGFQPPVLKTWPQKKRDRAFARQTAPVEDEDEAGASQPTSGHIPPVQCMWSNMTHNWCSKLISLPFNTQPLVASAS